MVLDNGNVHLYRLFGVTDNSQLALVYVYIGIFFQCQFEQIDLRIVLSGVNLLDTVGACFKIGLDDLVLDILGYAVKEKWLRL